ncbi:hypothetical protein M501DRAFT_1060902 [Patellaria atrata CBS 101060]|uniref:Uncharacterized protein n=1 Tax=Patellaria atrata CBS 101060 TaxID=1346257 RepID=A0A9P4S4G8_9PEZI|nr:hypothetical protein M501DRAFT_1060902 [Patellaria atrata CBS 101060]
MYSSNSTSFPTASNTNDSSHTLSLTPFPPPARASSPIPKSSEQPQGSRKCKADSTAPKTARTESSLTLASPLSPSATPAPSPHQTFPLLELYARVCKWLEDVEWDGNSACSGEETEEEHTEGVEEEWGSSAEGGTEDKETKGEEEKVIWTGRRGGRNLRF